jgi:hypothetical protein
VVSAEERHQRTLASTLEHVFGLAGDALTLDSVSFSVISHLSEGEALPAIGYLTACYKRLQAKKSSAASDKLKEDLEQ